MGGRSGGGRSANLLFDNFFMKSAKKCRKMDRGNGCIKYLPPTNEVFEGYVFTRVILFTGGSASVHAGIPPTAPGADPPGIPPSGADPPGTPRRRACWEIRSMHGRYASYWNAIFFIMKTRHSELLQVVEKPKVDVKGS